MEKQFFILLISLFSAHFLIGQNTEVTIAGVGCGSSTVSAFPVPAIYGDWWDTNIQTWSVTRYEKTDNGLSSNAGKNLTQINYYADCNRNTTYSSATNQKIYIKEVADGSSEISSLSYPNLSTYTLVFEGDITWTVNSNGVPIQFNRNGNTFAYNGGDLLVYFENKHNNPIEIGGGLAATVPILGENRNNSSYNNRVKYKKFNNTSFSTTATADGTKRSIPKTKFVFSPATPLPIELLSFSAENQGINTTFTWQTATEINNNYFELQQSIDGENFSNIAKIKGAGNSNSLKNYTHNYSNNNCLYYRLKQTDFDGTFSYSKIIYHCGASKDNTANSVKIYPNPLNEGNALQIDIEKPTPMLLVSIFNLQGQKVFQKQWKDNELQQHFSTSLTLEKGIYWLKINQDNYRKLVIK